MFLLMALNIAAAAAGIFCLSALQSCLLQARMQLLLAAVSTLPGICTAVLCSLWPLLLLAALQLRHARPPSVTWCSMRAEEPVVQVRQRLVMQGQCSVVMYDHCDWVKIQYADTFTIR